MYISFTSECRTALPQTLLIFRLRLLNRALPQTTPHFGVMQISTLVWKGEWALCQYCCQLRLVRDRSDKSSLSCQLAENPLNYEVLITLSVICALSDWGKNSSQTERIEGTQEILLFILLQSSSSSSYTCNPSWQLFFWLVLKSPQSWQQGCIFSTRSLYNPFILVVLPPAVA